jgi:hypothetical protein
VISETRIISTWMDEMDGWMHVYGQDGYLMIEKALKEGV